VSAVADVRGLKRICGDCGVRFYDLNKRPIICPSCGAEFDGEIKVKARRGRSASVPEDTAIKPAEAEAAKAKASDDDDELEEEDDGAEIVSLEDLETVEKGDEDDAKVPYLNGDSDDDDDDLGDLDTDLADLDDEPDSDDDEEDEEPA
jgi:uncharacterized protein (TIGR02300 family)